MNNRYRTALVSGVLALALLAMIGVGEFYAATRFQSQYVTIKEYSTLTKLLLIGERERGTLVSFDGRGRHAASPGTTRDEVIEKLKRGYPNEFDPKKITWVLTDDDAAFYFKLTPNWAGVAYLFAVTFVVSFLPVHLLVGRGSSPFLLEGRLADVLALIQVLALDRCAHRSESGLCTEMQGRPVSSQSWADLAKAHPELFRVKSSGENVISLVARHVSESTGQPRDPLPTEYVSDLLKLAVEVHDRELQRTKGWHVWVPIIVAVVAGVFTVVGAVVGR